jgi:hypothetical protein
VSQLATKRVSVRAPLVSVPMTSGIGARGCWFRPVLLEVTGVEGGSCEQGVGPLVDHNSKG